jgi:hypothetical protein
MSFPLNAKRERHQLWKDLSKIVALLVVFVVALFVYAFLSLSFDHNFLPGG